MYHGGFVQGTWAYECRSYFISATCFEDCGILDPFGRPLALANDYTRLPMAKINLDYVMVHLGTLVSKLAEIRKKYRDAVTIEIPEHVGPALIFSNTLQRTALDIAREFELELLDDLLARSRRVAADNRSAAAPKRAAQRKKSRGAK